MFRIGADVVEAMIQHARADAPMECCGLLVGAGDTIDECAPTANVRQSETAYQVDPAAHFTVLRRVRAEGRRIIGAYHSHPRSAAIPSPTDVAEAHDTELLYVIVSLADPDRADVRGYAVTGGRWTETPIDVPGAGTQACPSARQP